MGPSQEAAASLVPSAEDATPSQYAVGPRRQVAPEFEEISITPSNDTAISFVPSAEDATEDQSSFGKLVNVQPLGGTN